MYSAISPHHNGRHAWRFIIMEVIKKIFGKIQEAIKKFLNQFESDKFAEGFQQGMRFILITLAIDTTIKAIIKKRRN